MTQHKSWLYFNGWWDIDAVCRSIAANSVFVNMHNYNYWILLKLEGISTNEPTTLMYSIVTTHKVKRFEFWTNMCYSNILYRKYQFVTMFFLSNAIKLPANIKYRFLQMNPWMNNSCRINLLHLLKLYCIKYMIHFMKAPSRISYVHP